MNHNCYFKKTTFRETIYQKIKHFDRLKTQRKPLVEKQLNALNNLREFGYTIFENYLSSDTLNYLKSEADSKYKHSEYELPNLAQSKIDNNNKKHKDLIENHFVANNKELEKLGLTYDLPEITNYQDSIDKFKPHNLKLYLPGNDSKFVNVWLDPFLLEIIEAYMGLRPYMAEAYIRRSFPVEHRVMNHFWHRDLNHKWMLMKMFVFLSDCELTSGPHVYIEKTHKDFSLNGQAYFTDDQVDRYLQGSNNRVIKSEVKAGTVVLEDTFGLHHGDVPREGHRDLGFAVFFPLNFLRRKQISNYSVSRSVYNNLSSYQQSFVPGLPVAD